MHCPLQGLQKHAAASGRFGLLQRERVGSREGLVQDLDRGCGEEDKTLPMAGCLGCEAYEYARRQENAKSSNISNRVGMEIKGKAGAGQVGEEDKGLEGLEGKGQEGDDSKGH